VKTEAAGMSECTRARFAFAALALTLCLPSGSGAAAPPSPGVTVTRATLANGLRVVVLRDTLAPVVSTWLNVQAGADDEAYTGLAHAQEHMFFRGSKTLSGAGGDQVAGLTGDQDNADTQSEITQYFHFVPSADLDLALQLDRNRFVGLLDTQKDWSEERGAIEQEVTHDNSDANFRLYVKMLHVIVAGTPYADDGLGTVASFDHNIQAPQLRAFYNAWYHPNNAIYVIAGNVDPQATIALVKRFMGTVPAVPVPAHKPVHLAPLVAAHFTDTSDQSTTEAMIGYRFPGYEDRLYAASVVLADVLNSQRGDLYGLVAAGKAQSVEADASAWPKAGMLQLISHVAVATAPQRALDDLAAVAAGYRTNGVPQDLIDAAKQREIVKEHTSAASTFELAATWSESLAVEKRTPDQDVAAISAVTKADVDAVAHDYLIADTASTGYAIPKVGDAAAGGQDTAGASGETKTTRTTNEPLPPWALASLAHLKVPERTIAPVTYTLPNGLRLVVQTERASPSIALAGLVLHNAGLEETAGTRGVQSLVDALMPFGTTSLTRLEYQAKLDAISATVSNGYSFSLDVPSENIESGLALLADDELHPAFDAKSFDVVKAERVDALTGDATNPTHLAAVAAADALYPTGDPARAFPTPDGVKALSLDDVKSAYAASFRPDLTTIVIVGDITPERARTLVQNAFGSWQATGARPSVFPAPVANNAPMAANIPATGRLQDTVTLAETLPLTLADPDRGALEVANAVLSGDFSSILIRDMRVTTGYVYNVGSGLEAGKTRSLFRVQYACAPNNFAKAQAVLERDLQQLGMTPLPDERLQRAKSHLLSEVTLEAASYDSLARRLLANASIGLPADHDYALAGDELAATPATVRDAIARFIRPLGFVRTVEGPTPQ
jgi:zinc protease